MIATFGHGILYGGVALIVACVLRSVLTCRQITRDFELEREDAERHNHQR